MANTSHIQQLQEEQVDRTNASGQLHAKSNFIDARTGPTSHAKTGQFLKPGFIGARSSYDKAGQFLKPGFIDARYNTQFRETQPLANTDLLSSLPLTPRWYNRALSLGGNNLLSPPPGESKDDVDSVDSRKTMVVPTLEESSHPQISQKAAHPPYARHRTTLATLTMQYWLVLRFLLSDYRTTWFFHAVGELLMPMSIAFFVVFVGGVTSPEKGIYLLGGNMAISIALGPVTFLINKVGWARQSKEFHFWIALPISKLNLIFAIVSVSLLFELPGLLGIYVFGTLLFGLPFSGTWALIPLIPLGVLPLIGLGILLGIVVPNGHVASVISNILIVVFSVLSPLMLPLEVLPVPFRIVAQFMPTTYVADAFRAVLGAHTGTHLTLDLVVLACFSAVFLTITYFWLDWRNA